MKRRELFKAAVGAAVVAAVPYKPATKELVLDFTGPAMTAKEAYSPFEWSRTETRLYTDPFYAGTLT
jgi:hypothetical protein